MQRVNPWFMFAIFLITNLYMLFCKKWLSYISQHNVMIFWCFSHCSGEPAHSSEPLLLTYTCRWKLRPKFRSLSPLDTLAWTFTLCMLGNFSCFFCRLLLFSKLTFQRNSFRNTIRVANSLDPDQARHSGLIWVQTVCKDYQQMTKFTAGRQSVKGSFCAYAVSTKKSCVHIHSDE